MNMCLNQVSNAHHDSYMAWHLLNLDTQFPPSPNRLLTMGACRNPNGRARSTMCSFSAGLRTLTFCDCCSPRAVMVVTLTRQCVCILWHVDAIYFTWPNTLVVIMSIHQHVLFHLLMNWPSIQHWLNSHHLHLTVSFSSLSPDMDAKSIALISW